MISTVLVTGASKGIGRAIALKLAADGFLVVVHYHGDRAGAEATLDSLQAAGGQGRLIQFDIADRQGCRVRLEADMAEHGAYYGVVCNAGIIRAAPFPPSPTKSGTGCCTPIWMASTTCSSPASCR